MGLIGNHEDVAPFESAGILSPFSGRNFWIVVNTTPPLATASSSRRLPTFGLDRCLPEDFMAALELSEELIVQVVSICQENQSWVFHRRSSDDAAGVEEH